MSERYDASPIAASREAPQEASNRSPQGATATMLALLATFQADQGEEDPSITLGQLFDRMEERAFGLLLLLLSLPCCLPFVYLLPQIVALPMLLLSGQLALGRSAPWLPAAIRDRSLSTNALHGVVTRAKRYLYWVEVIARPRLTFLSNRTGSRVIGLLMLIPTASILLPLPLTNTVPGMGVALTSVGLIERDGFLIIGGLLLGLIWVGLLLLGGQALIAALFSLLLSR